MSAARPPHASPRVRPVSQLAPRELAWLWPGRLALGKLALLDGDPGLGKSYLALDLCARLSTGRPWPDEQASPGPAASLVLNGEDGEEDTTRGRLEALGADPDRVFVLAPDDDGAAGPLALPAQLGVLDEALAQARPRLLVLDPVVAFLGPGVVTASDQSVRRALLPLALLAARYGCAVLLVRHLNKARGRRAVYRGGGSIGLVAACRSAWLAAPDPLTSGRCVLAQVKNNLAAAQPSLAYALEAQAQGPPRLTWLGESRYSADQLLGSPLSARWDGALGRACHFLEDVLKAGPRTSRQIWAAAQQEDLSERTLFRAKQLLQVRTERVGKGEDRVSFWMLPAQETPAAPPELPPYQEGMDWQEWKASVLLVYGLAGPLDEM